MGALRYLVLFFMTIGVIKLLIGIIGIVAEKRKKQ